MNIAAARFFSKIALNPVKYYVKGIKIGAGFTLMVNGVQAFNNDQNAVISLYREPAIFALVTLFKANNYGVFWPVIPFVAYNNWRKFSVIGSGAEVSINNQGYRRYSYIYDRNTSDQN